MQDATTPPEDAPFARYRELLRRVDDFAAGVTDKHAASMHCQLGCTACCRQDLTVSRVEADHIRAYLAEHPVAPHDPARTQTDDHPLFESLAFDVESACTFLGAGGACTIYPVRPLICRTHGLPLALGADRTVCPLNFVELSARHYEEIPDEDCLDLPRLNTLLAMIDDLYCASIDADPDDERITLSALRHQSAAAPTDAADGD